MNIKLTKPPVAGEIKAIVSKSAAHRIMIAAALSDVDITPYCTGLSLDITATKQCLLALKAARRTQADSFDGICQLPCGESGSTLRFLIPVAGVLGIPSAFHCEGRLPDRPMEPFLEQLAEHGCHVHGRTPKQLEGRLSGGTFRLPGNISSQYVTGLLFALPLAEEDSRIIITGALQSRPYIDLSLQVLARAGICITETAGEDGATTFYVPGGQVFRMPEEALADIEGDWSNSAFWICADAMASGQIRCLGLDPDSMQGDKAIADIVSRMQTAGRQELTLDVSQIPDLVPAIAALACGRNPGSITHITGAVRLRFKESDRLKTVTQVLTELGAAITEQAEGLTIRAAGKLRGGTVDSFGDHRIVMMAAIARCITEADVIITGAEAVNKSYPRFFEDYVLLGGEAACL